VPSALFAPAQRGGGWGSFGESFLRMNEAALRALDVEGELFAGSEGLSIRLVPGGHAGAIPLRSAQSGKSLVALSSGRVLAGRVLVTC
jgi:hypothetical protein